MTVPEQGWRNKGRKKDKREYEEEEERDTHFMVLRVLICKHV